MRQLKQITYILGYIVERIAFAIFYVVGGTVIVLMMIIDRKFREQMGYIGRKGRM